MNFVTLDAPIKLVRRLGQGVLSGRRMPGPALLDQLLQAQPRGPDLQPLADTLLARCAEAFHSSRGALLFPKEASGFNSIHYLGSSVSPVQPRLPGGQSMPGWLACQPTPLRAPAFEALPQRREMPSDSRVLLKELDAAVYGAVVFSHGMAALLALGPRRNTKPYNHQDLALFEAACRVFSLKLDIAWQCRQLQHQAEALSAAQEGALLTTRMATLGQMVAEVAHEVANSLQALNALTALLARQPSIESTRRHLQVADEEITHTGNMLRELLSFARPSAPAGQLVDLQDLMDSVLKLASIHPSSSNVTIDLACHVWRPRVKASKEQLKQVFYNLVKNGLDAMPNGGTLSIQVGQRSGFVRVEVSDTGEGIPWELRNRVFEPFYTTKAPHRGTRLGLSISRRIVNQHGGRIWLSDTQVQGVKVTVELPASADAC